MGRFDEVIFGILEHINVGMPLTSMNQTECVYPNTISKLIGGDVISPTTTVFCIRVLEKTLRKIIVI